MEFVQKVLAFVQPMFQGRMSRRPYIIRGIILLVIGLALIAAHSDGKCSTFIYFVGIIICDFFAMSLDVRRLHDIGHKGYLAALAFVPIANELFGLYLAFRRGTVGENLYGPDPHA